MRRPIRCFLTTTWRARPATALAALLCLGSVGTLHAQVQPEPPDPWTDIGGALPGAAGSPLLTGGGSLFGGSLVAVDVSSAAVLAPGMIFISLVSQPVPFYGGVLKANPHVTSVPFNTNLDGEFTWLFTMPLGLAEGTHLWFQAAIADAGAVQGVALTNALRARTPPQSFDVMGTYIQAVMEAQQGVNDGWLPQATLDYLINNQPQLSSNGAALLDAVTATLLGSQYSLSGPSGGGVVSGGTWVGESLVGLDVLTGNVEVGWVTDGNTNRLTEHGTAGGILLGSIWATQLGEKWKEHCGGTPEDRLYKECGAYKLHYKQGWGFFKVSSGSTEAEILCAPCP